MVLNLRPTSVISDQLERGMNTPMDVDPTIVVILEKADVVMSDGPDTIMGEAPATADGIVASAGGDPSNAVGPTVPAAVPAAAGPRRMVRFSPLVKKETVDRATPEEAQAYWYRETDFEAFRIGMKYQASYSIRKSRREMAREGRKDAAGEADPVCGGSGSSIAVPPMTVKIESTISGPTSSSSSNGKSPPRGNRMTMMGDDDFRGCEGYLPVRRKYRDFTIGCVLAMLGKKGPDGKTPKYTPEDVARVTQHCTSWSAQVAYFQAYHDYARVYQPALLPYIPKVAPAPPPSIFPYDALGYKCGGDVSLTMMLRDD
jgi:hypothetical protein